MDGCHLESCSRLHKNQSRLHALLCRDIRGTFSRSARHPFEFGFDLRLVPEKLGEPIRWSKPKKIFVNSMSDLFHEGVSDEYIEKVCRVMLAANWHTYQILTKRANRMAAMLQDKLRTAAKASHIWWGVSVENRQHGSAAHCQTSERQANRGISLGRTTTGRHRQVQFGRHPLGNRWRRERSWRTAHAG